PDSAEATAASSTTGRDQTPKRALRKRGCLAGRSSGQAALVTLELDPRDPRGSLGENRCRVEARSRPGWATSRVAPERSHPGARQGRKRSAGQGEAHGI